MLKRAWREAAARLRGDALVEAELRRDGGPFRERAPGAVLALGKAAAEMAHGAWTVLGLKPRYVVAAPRDAAESLRRRARGGASVWTGEHPVPGKGSLDAGRALLRAAGEAGEAGVLGLISGGGSALACAPAEGLTLEDKQSATALLLASGAPIEEVNAVRRHLSSIKGGGLARALGGAGPALVLVLSDVPRGGAEAVASGPFAADPATFAECVEICRRRGVWDALPAGVRARLERGGVETLKPGDALLSRVEHRVLAGPIDLASAAAAALGQAGLQDVRVREEVVTGDVGTIAREYAEFAASAPPGATLVAAGEPTLRVDGPGRGGRAQHLALLVARELTRTGRKALFLSAGSDGRDGPTDHAGALVGRGDFDAQAEEELRAFDSAAACARLGVAIPARRTGTNLCDLHIVAVQARRKPRG